MSILSLLPSSSVNTCTRMEFKSVRSFNIWSFSSVVIMVIVDYGFLEANLIKNRISSEYDNNGSASCNE